MIKKQQIKRGITMPDLQPELQIAVNPSRAYDCQTVLDSIEQNASYREFSPAKREVEASILGLNRYFAEFCRERPVLRKGRDVNPSKEFSA
jgi:hypothetical protein